MRLNSGEKAPKSPSVSMTAFLRRAIIFLAPLLLSLSLWAAAAEAPAQLSKKIKLAEDLGPAAIDVSSYPEEMRKTYQDIFLHLFSFFGTTARIINSPIIEMDEHLEAQERRDNPNLFSDPDLAQISRDGWKKSVEEIHQRPPCCGACPLLSLEDARALRRFLVYDSIQRKTGPNAKAWIEQRKDLLRRFNESKRRTSS
jgi:hypothetical protein